MTDIIKSNDYKVIFDEARLSASLRIQELNEAAALSAVSTVLDVLRPASTVALRESHQQILGAIRHARATKLPSAD